jgi:hypothetical protein
MLAFIRKWCFNNKENTEVVEGLIDSLIDSSFNQIVDETSLFTDVSLSNIEPKLTIEIPTVLEIFETFREINNKTNIDDIQVLIPLQIETFESNNSNTFISVPEIGILNDSLCKTPEVGIMIDNNNDNNNVIDNVTVTENTDLTIEEQEDTIENAVEEEAEDIEEEYEVEKEEEYEVDEGEDIEEEYDLEQEDIDKK